MRYSWFLSFLGSGLQKIRGSHRRFLLFLFEGRRGLIGLSLLGFLGGLGALAFCFFYGMGEYGLLNNNEGLYGQIPKEMLESHSYILPQLNHLPYLEKPPLLYWLIALSYHFFGISEFSARCVPACSGVLTAAVLFWAGYRYRNLATGCLSAWIFSTSLGTLLFFRMVFFDGLLTFFLSCSFLFFFEWFHHRHQVFLISFYSMVGLAILTKGGVAGLLFMVGVIAFFLVTRSSLRTLRSFLNPWGLVCFVCIVLPWHLLASLHDPGFAWFYFINEHLFRFLGLRQPHDYYHGPFYYYIPRLFVYFMPWSVVMSVFFFRSLQTCGSLFHKYGPPSYDSSKELKEFHSFERFLEVWAGVIFVFFSLSQAKANYYVLPVLPPLALLLALKMNALQEGEPKRYLSKVMGRVTGIVCLLVPGTLLLGVFFASPLSQWTKNPPQVEAILMHLSPATLGFWMGLNLIALSVFSLYPFAVCEKILAGASLLMRQSLGIRKQKGVSCRATLPMRWRQWGRLGVLGGQPLVLLMVSLPIVKDLEDQFSAKNLAQEAFLLHPKRIGAEQRLWCPLYLYKDYEKISSLLFYLPGPLVLIESQSNDLLYGQQKGIRPDLFLTPKTWTSQKNRTSCDSGLIFVHEEQIQNFQKSFPDFFILAHRGPIALFGKKTEGSPRKGETLKGEER